MRSSLSQSTYIEQGGMQKTARMDNDDEDKLRTRRRERERPAESLQRRDQRRFALLND